MLVTTSVPLLAIRLEHVRLKQDVRTMYIRRDMNQWKRSIGLKGEMPGAKRQPSGGKVTHGVSLAGACFIDMV